ncbi:hypothetical protein TNCV_4524031 [Trichonephila clavipes]|nr:hypothetical protein TNCV_4524031 [Trichonephila clavipes]
MLVRLLRAPVLSGGLRRKTQLFSSTLYMAASSKTPSHQSKGPQKFKTPLQVPVFPGNSLLCRHTSCKKTIRLNFIPLSPGLPQDFVERSGGSKGESNKVKIARERRVRETRTHKRVSPCQKITRVPQDCDTRTHLKKVSPLRGTVITGFQEKIYCFDGEMVDCLERKSCPGLMFF